MSLPREFWADLPQMTDGELYQVLLQQDDYLPEALAAVKVELLKRNPSSKRFAEMVAAARRARSLAAQFEARDRTQRHFGEWTFHLITLLAFPLIKFLISVLAGS